MFCQRFEVLCGVSDRMKRGIFSCLYTIRTPILEVADAGHLFQKIQMLIASAATLSRRSAHGAHMVRSVCVPKIRFGNIGNEGRREQVWM